MQFSAYEDAKQYLLHEVRKTDRKVFNDTATIEKNFKIMELLDNPQNKHFAVHIAATSGKGSICYLINAILRAHSNSTGMIQSPHVYDLRERIQLNGDLISKQQFTETLGTILSRLQTGGIVASYFEILIAMSFYIFGKSDLDYTIIETGFGGRLDATNVMSGEDKIAILGQIGFDHTEVLGNTLVEIATEKAGIVQKNGHVIALRQDPGVNQVFENKCKEMNASLEWVESTPDYQETNQNIAVAACKTLANVHNWTFNLKLAEQSVEDIFIPGRFEKRTYKNHQFILDGAHNTQKLAAFSYKMNLEKIKPSTIILALGGHKDIKECLLALRPIAARIITTQYSTKEQDMPVLPIPAPEISAMCQELGIEYITTTSSDDALQSALEYTDPIGVTGSFYLLGEMNIFMKA